MVLAIQQKGRPKSRADILLDTPENTRRKRRIMGVNVLRQAFSNLFVLGSIIFIIHGSSLYLSAFIDMGEVVGSSQSVRSESAKASVGQMPRVKQSSFISPISEHFRTNRFYMRRGQSVLATYSLPKKTRLHLSIQQCKTIPILEIFKCTPIGDQYKSVKNRTTGYVEFTATRPGFYHFVESAVKPNTTKLTVNIDYQVVWQRGGKRAR